MPLIAFLILVVYYIGSTILRSQPISIKHFLLLADCVLLSTTALLISIEKIDVSKIFAGLYILAAIESLVCVLQWGSLIGSLNHYFAVTGTWVNPNVTGLF